MVSLDVVCLTWCVTSCEVPSMRSMTALSGGNMSQSSSSCCTEASRFPRGQGSVGSSRMFYLVSLNQTIPIFWETTKSFSSWLTVS